MGIQSTQSAFLTDEWAVALIGVAVPVVFMMLTVKDIAEAAKNTVADRLRRVRLDSSRGTTTEHASFVGSFGGRG